ncbi:MAG: GNAT family N-acetyltransferase [Saprospiraceae bacterium]|nr:GNAT family N-acetyltransferase [Saprospiraceae bacterium]
MIWQPHLTNKWVKIRPLHHADFDALFQVAKDPLVWEQHPSKKRSTLDGFGVFFRESLDSQGALVILDQQSQVVIGSSRFQYRDSMEDAVEIGWTFLARKYWGGKYNLAVKSLMMTYAFEHVSKVVLFIDRENIRSQKAAGKIGASQIFDQTLLRLAGKSPDTMAFTMLRTT